MKAVEIEKAHSISKGVCGLPETMESIRNLKIKYAKLLGMIKQASYIVVLTGAGISTAAGSKLLIRCRFFVSDPYPN
jgi:hypothetical protein